MAFTGRFLRPIRASLSALSSPSSSSSSSCTRNLFNGNYEQLRTWVKVLEPVLQGHVSRFQKEIERGKHIWHFSCNWITEPLAPSHICYRWSERASTGLVGCFRPPGRRPIHLPGFCKEILAACIASYDCGDELGPSFYSCA
ncbi:hypothetical protein BVC80_887g50 [Macleaya cordata]|uniref:Uncharacterized protein n=1 Tax=Macleaya cordata TaxID=56857 RepID=A0A200RDG5_MACCD|nr:hypothetical protein BVC80_887g50 [Macleaya cordata]